MTEKDLEHEDAMVDVDKLRIILETSREEEKSSRAENKIERDLRRTFFLHRISLENIEWDLVDPRMHLSSQQMRYALKHFRTLTTYSWLQFAPMSQHDW